MDCKGSREAGATQPISAISSNEQWALPVTMPRRPRGWAERASAGHRRLGMHRGALAFNCCRYMSATPKFWSRHNSRSEFADPAACSY
jgi:hypothetical protein